MVNIKAGVLLCICMSFLFFREEMKEITSYHRHLRCRRALTEVGDVRKMAESLSDPCYVSYPEMVEDYVLSPDSQEEPTFKTVSDGDGDSVFSDIQADDGNIIITPGTNEEQELNEAEFDFLDSFKRQLYNAPTVPREPHHDENAVCYVVVTTECPTLEDSEPDGVSLTEESFENDPVVVTELYEASAVLNAVCCNITEQTKESTYPNQFAESRHLETQALGVLSAAEMNYEM